MARPRVLMNCACSLDGKLAAPDGTPMPFSDETDWRRVHGLRASVDAILVGIGTILSDDPSLKVKPDLAPVPPGHELLRVILDSKGRTPLRSKVCDGSAPSLVVTGPGVLGRYGQAGHATVAKGIDGRLDLGAVMDLLAERQVRDVLVEGGPTVHRAFAQAGLAEVWTIYQAPMLVGGEGPCLWPGKPSSIGRRMHVENVEAQGKGVLWTLRP